MPRSEKPSEKLREQLRRAVVEDGRGYDAIGSLVGVSGPTLHRFLNTPNTGSVALSKLLNLFGFSDYELAGLDGEQLELLRVFEAARAQGRDGQALVSAFKTITGVDAPRALPAPPKSRGSDAS